MNKTIARVSVLASITLLAGCVHPKTSPCIITPAVSDAREKEIGAKLSADLAAGIGNPNLDVSYKNKVNIAYASMSQKAVEQLVLIEFLACIKKHHQDDVSPATVAVMEEALRKAILLAVGAQSLSGPLDPGTKSEIRNSKYGQLKLDKLAEIGL